MVRSKNCAVGFLHLDYAMNEYYIHAGQNGVLLIALDCPAALCNTYVKNTCTTLQVVGIGLILKRLFPPSFRPLLLAIPWLFYM